MVRLPREGKLCGKRRSPTKHLHLKGRRKREAGKLSMKKYLRGRRESRKKKSEGAESFKERLMIVPNDTEKSKKISTKKNPLV